MEQVRHFTKNSFVDGDILMYIGYTKVRAVVVYLYITKVGNKFFYIVKLTTQMEMF